LRRAAAAALVVTAGIMAIIGRPGPLPGVSVLAVVHDLPAGSTLEPADLTALTVTAVPDGALRAPPQALGHLLSAPVRRGELLTDVRLLSATGPNPGAGRVAVPIRPADPGTADLLSPGAHVAVLSVAENGVATLLAADAVVLTIPPALKSDPAKRLVVLSVPRGVADRITAASITGAIAIRFA
jgi:hypothetical protein